MFDIGWGELVVIGVVALIAIGPKELPGVLRTAGQWMGKIRRMASDFQDQFKEAMREAELEDLKKDTGLDDLKQKVDAMTDTAKDFTNFDPLGTVRNEIEKGIGDPLDLDGKPSEPAGQTSTPETNTIEGPPAAQPEPAADPTPERKAGEGA